MERNVTESRLGDEIVFVCMYLYIPGHGCLSLSNTNRGLQCITHPSSPETHQMALGLFEEFRYFLIVPLPFA
jgi:hypothetical protein